MTARPARAGVLRCRFAGMRDPVLELNASLADRYIVEREIGQGGMATVYLARDVRHERKVAIKVLRPELAAVIGAERFVREIQTIAALQHPHILGLIDSGETQGTAYYVMPFIEGESLRDWLDRDKQLPIELAVRVATEVASALDYAHRHGVIHRDIKPENILLNDGSAMVADFGIALAVSSAGSRMTETGMSLGTPHYMSPEQAMGEREIGARSDIYALGCVLYEMLMGEPPFTGPTAQSIIARVITETPRPIALQRKSVPAHVEAAALKALEKLPADRYGSAREFSDAVNGKTVMSPASSASASASGARGATARVVAAAGIGLVIGALLFAGIAKVRRQPPPPQWTGELLGGADVSAGARVSPDGQTIAFEAMVDGQTQIAVLKPASGDWAILTHGTAQGIAGETAWSRDGARIYYSRVSGVPRGVWSISALGGDERLVLEDAATPNPLPDGSILVTRLNREHRSQLFRYRPETSQLDTLDATTDYIYGGTKFRAFPDGKRVVFLGRTTRDTTTGVYVLDLASGASRRLAADINIAMLRGFAFSPDARWVVLHRPAGDAEEFFAISVNGSRQERHLYTASATSQWAPDVGPDGSLYVDQSVRTKEIHRLRAGHLDTRSFSAITGFQVLPLADGRLLAMVRAAGKTRIVVLADGREPTRFVMTDDPTSSPMATLGRELVLLNITGADGRANLAAIAAKTGRIVKRFGGVKIKHVAGSPDGKTIFFTNESQVWRMSVDGGKPERVTAGNQVAIDPAGRYLVVSRITDAGAQLVRVPLDGGAEVPIALHGLHHAPGGLMPNAIGRDGRIALEVVSPQSWFWPAAILDPAAGTIALTASGKGYDMWTGWAFDGSLVSTASPLQSRMWRVKPKGAAKWWE